MATEQVSYFWTLDILKGAAIWGIILVHSRQKFENLASVFQLFDIGQMGCQVFFVISGFSVMMSCCRIGSVNHSGEKAGCFRDGFGSAFSFWRKRFGGILPGWHGAIVLVYLLNAASLFLFQTDIGFGKNRSPMAILCNLFLLQGLLPFCNNDVMAGGWYIGTLVVFYLAAPLLHVVMENQKAALLRWMPWLAQIGAAGAIIGLYLLTRERIGLTVLSNNGFVYFSFVNQSGCFLLGASLYFEYARDKRGFAGNLLLQRSLSALYAGALWFFFFSGYKGAFLLAPFLAGLSAYHLMKVMLFVETAGGAKRNPLTCLLRAYGRHSYEIYLVHGLFAWSMPIFLRRVLLSLGLAIDDTLLYLLLLLPVFALSYGFALLFQRAVVWLRNIVPWRRARPLDSWEQK